MLRGPFFCGFMVSRHGAAYGVFDMADKGVFSEEERSMLALALGLKIASLKRAQNGAEPGFVSLYEQTIGKYEALSGKVKTL